MTGSPFSPPTTSNRRAPTVSGGTPEQRQQDLARRLMRMDQILKFAGKAAAVAKLRVAVGGLGRYRRFTRKVRDFFALAAVTQEKLNQISAEMEPVLAGQMHTALERLHARMVVMFVEESELFFATFVRVRALPIGSYEMCGVELRGLLEIRKSLDDPLYDGESGQELRQRAERVAQLMRKTMQRMPPLPDFGDLPSIGPRGSRNKPIRPPRRQPPAKPRPSAGQEDQGEGGQDGGTRPPAAMRGEATATTIETIPPIETTPAIETIPPIETTPAIEPVREFPLPAAPVAPANIIPSAEPLTEAAGHWPDNGEGDGAEDGPDTVRELTLDMLNDSKATSPDTPLPQRPFREPPG